MSEIEKETIEVPARLFSKMVDMLKAYRGDFLYIADGGIDSINPLTSGTPYFESEKELEDYMEYLERTMFEVEEIKRNMDVTVSLSHQATKPDLEESDTPSGPSL